MYKSLPLAKILARLIPGLYPSCVTCGFEAEDHFHLFRDCPLAGATWTHLLPDCNPNNCKLFFSLDWQEWMEFSLSSTVGPNGVSFLLWFVGTFGVIEIDVFLINPVNKHIDSGYALILKSLVFTLYRMSTSTWNKKSSHGSHPQSQLSNLMWKLFRVKIVPLRWVQLLFMMLSFNGS